MRRLYPEHPFVGVGAVIVRDGMILLGKRRNEPGKGKWSIPGGLVELGESVEQTVIREVKEETGLDVEKPDHIDVVDKIDINENGKVRYHFVIIDYFVKLKGGSLKASGDAAGLKWVALEEVEKHELTPTFRIFFQKNRMKLEKLNSCH